MVKKILLIIIIVFIFIMLILFPSTYTKSIEDGFYLFFTKVAPISFPFFFFTKLLSSKIKIKNSKFTSLFVFTMSLFSGYPNNAKMIESLYSDHKLTFNESKILMPFSSISSPIFIIAVVGNTFLNNIQYGYIIYLSQVLGVIINGLIYYCFLNKNSAQNVNLSDSTNSCSLLSVMIDTISALCVIGGYITLSYFIIDLLNNLNIINILISFFCLFLSKEESTIIVFSLFEITRGLSLIPKNYALKILPITAGLIAFGGLSIGIQSISFLQKTNIKACFYLSIKITQAIITYWITNLLLLLII